MEEKISTNEKLARALEDLGDRKLKHVIKRARAGYYDDYESPINFPSIELFYEMRARGYDEFCVRIMNGEFDATEEESDRWANSLDGMMAFNDPIAMREAKRIARAIALNQGQSEEDFEKGWAELEKKMKLGD